MRLPISMAVAAASPPLLPTLPPARSSACTRGPAADDWVEWEPAGGGRAVTRLQHRPVLVASAAVPAHCCTAAKQHQAVSCSAHTPTTPALSPKPAPHPLCPPHLLHRVTGEDTEDDGHPAVGAGVEHPAGGAPHHSVVVGGGAAHLQMQGSGGRAAMWRLRRVSKGRAARGHTVRGTAATQLHASAAAAAQSSSAICRQAAWAYCCCRRCRCCAKSSPPRLCR